MKRRGIHKIEAHIATSVSEYLGLIRDHVKYPNAWYRGHSLSSYKLVPSIFRTAQLYKSLLGRVGEFSMTRPDSGEFLIMDHDIATQVMRKYPDSKGLTTTEIIYHNQHHGVPTRMMDFSGDPLVALFFCVENRKYWNAKHTKSLVRKTLAKYGEYCDTSGSISIIDPILTNKESIGVNGILKKDEEIDQHLDSLFPVAIAPTFTNPRIKAQKGKFIYFGSKMDEYEHYNPFRTRLIKIHIPNRHKESVFDELCGMNMTYSRVYPDFQGFAKEANCHMEREFVTRCNAMTRVPAIQRRANGHL